MISTQRFSDRVENYVLFRPHYPREVIECLRERYHFDASQILADIGSGTGISTELFLANGNPCFAVEPNHEMREASEKLLGHFPNFQSVDGTAENTTLAAQSVNWVIVGQAFHWFDNAASRREFERILKPTGRVLLMWNQRNLETEGIARDYNDLLIRYVENYKELSHYRIDLSKIEAFFAPNPVEVFEFANQQLFDFNSLVGRMLSSSYVPQSSDMTATILDELKTIFNHYERGGQVEFSYRTQLYVGTLG